jgi:hypothetical protein
MEIGFPERDVKKGVRHAVLSAARIEMRCPSGSSPIPPRAIAFARRLLAVVGDAE